MIVSNKLAIFTTKGSKYTLKISDIYTHFSSLSSQEKNSYFSQENMFSNMLVKTVYRYK